MPKQWTHDEFIERLNLIDPHIVTNDMYVNFTTPLHFKHLICGFEWDAKPSSTMRSKGCPKCHQTIKKTQKEFEEDMLKQDPHISVIGSYVNNHSNITVKSDLCGHSWDSKPLNLLSGHTTCPICNGKVIVVGENDFASHCPDLVKYLDNPNDGEKYTYGSHSKVLCKCPDCGQTKMQEIKSLSYQGFSCDYCDNGLSYPNRFLRMLVSQLPVIHVKFEYCPTWSSNRKYDCYFEYNDDKYVIEMDGGFHYRSSSMTKYTKDDVIKNDRFKDLMALKHDINMIRIDCRYSNQNYIVKHLLESRLSEIFDLSQINWDKCGEFATSNYIRFVCDYFEEHKKMFYKYEIAEQLGIHPTTLSDYLRIGTKYGWCDNTRQRYFKR